MTKSNDHKNEQLGMPYGTACGRLRKMILLSLIKELGQNTCFQCGNAIETVAELSIEHKIPWIDNPNLFWELDNIAFSHLLCNIKAARTIPGRQVRKDGSVWCARCKRWKNPSDFHRNRSRTSGHMNRCKVCRKERDNGSWRKEWRERNRSRKTIGAPPNNT